MGFCGLGLLETESGKIQELWAGVAEKKGVHSLSFEASWLCWCCV